MWRPLNGRLEIRMALWLQAKVRGLQRRLYASLVCDNSTAEAAYVALYK